jgi:excisionase family DNA binding protein
MDESIKFYNLQQVSEILGISVKEILNMISLKKIPAVEEGESVKIKVEDLERFLDSIDEKENVEEEGVTRTDKNNGEDREKEKREVEVLLGGKKALLEKAYKELLRKKQGLEEDINYLQYEYDEFKSRIRRLITEELNMFLRKIEKENLRESDEIVKGNFGKDLDIDEDISKVSEGKANAYDDDRETLMFESNKRNDEKLKLGEENQIRLKGESGTDN